MAGSRSAHSLETTIVMCASGKHSRKAAILGVVRIRSPIRLSCRRRIFIERQNHNGAPQRRNELLGGYRPQYKYLSCPSHSYFVGTEQSCPKMVPREVLNHATSRG